MLDEIRSSISNEVLHVCLTESFEKSVNVKQMSRVTVLL